MAKLYNLARVRTASTGQGAVTLGSAVEGFLTFAQAGVQDSDVVAYAIRDGANSEIGYGAYTSATATLTRNVRKSTNSDAAISLSGNAEVIISPSAAEFDFAVLPEDYGAAGDGTTDDAAAMQSALTAAAGKTLRLRAGVTYKITDELTLPAGGIDIEGQGATLDFSTMAAGASLGDKVGLSATGTLGDAITVSSNITAGDTQITVTSTATLAVGDLVRISSTQFFMGGVSSGTNLRGEIHRILTIDNATNFSIEGEMLFSYATASTAVVRKITPVSFVGLRNLNLTMGGVSSAHAALQVTYGQDVGIYDVNVLDAEDVGIGLITCFGGRVENCRVRNSTSPGGAIGNTGYGVALYDATRDVVVEGLRAENCRHAVAGGRTYPVVFITVSNCSSDDNGLNAKAFDCHEPCFYWTFEGNKVTGGEGGFVIRGQYITVRGNHVERTASNGIQVETFITNTDGQSGIVIDGNTVLNTGSNGILLDGTEATIKHSVVSNNVCRANELNGIYTWLIENCHIDDNKTEGATNQSGTEGQGFYIDGDTSNRSANVTVRNGSSKAQPRSALRAEFIDGLVLSGFEAEGNSLHGIELLDCTSISIAGGTVEASGNASSNAVSLTRCNRATIVGLTGIGSTSNATSDGIRASGSSQTDLVVVGCVFHEFGRRAVNVTDTDHVIVIGNDGRTCSNSTKFAVASASNMQMHSNLPLADPGNGFTSFRINDTSLDHQYIFGVSELAADRTATLPLLTGNDTFVFEAHTQTLSNKVLTLPQINDTTADHQYIFGVSELVADRTVTLPLLTGNDTFVFAAHSQALTNKSVNLTNNTLTGTLAEFNTALSDGTFMAAGKFAKYFTADDFIPRTTNGPATGLTETTTNDIMVDTLDFDQTTQEGATLIYKLPKSWNLGTLTFIPYWTADAGTPAETVQWLVDAVAISNDDAIDAAFGTAQASADVLIATGDLHVGPESAAITVVGTPAAGDIVAIRIRRDVANDDLAADARLIGVEIFFTTNASNDA